MEQTAIKNAIAERGLECVIAGRHVVVPLSNVDQLIEYSRVALPLTHAGVGGLGVYEGALLLSLSVSPSDASRVLTKGVLLRGVVGHLTCALEVDRTLSFVELGATRERETNQESFLCRVITDDGRELLRVDVQSLVCRLLAADGAR